MSQENEKDWLEIIGKSLAYLCMQQATQHDSKRVSDLPARVKFLESLGIPTADAASILGTTANSIKTNLRQREKAKKTHGKKSKS